jgi:hypothetical protein
VQSLRVRNGSRISFSKSLNGAAYRLAVDAPSSSHLSLEVAVRGASLATVRGTMAETKNFNAADPPSLVVFEVVPPLLLDLIPAQPIALEFARSIPMADLSLFDTEEPVNLDAREVRNVSAILFAEVFLDSTRARRVEIRPFDELRFASSPGEIRTLSWSGVARAPLSLQYHGVVEGMSRGTLSHAVSLMPTNLDLLISDTNISMIWGAAAIVAAIIVSVVQLIHIRK